VQSGRTDWWGWMALPDPFLPVVTVSFGASNISCSEFSVSSYTPETDEILTTILKG